MKVQPSFKFHFDVQIDETKKNVYDFAIEADNLDQAKTVLADHLRRMLKEVSE